MLLMLPLIQVVLLVQLPQGLVGQEALLVVPFLVAAPYLERVSLLVGEMGPPLVQARHLKQRWLLQELALALMPFSLVVFFDR